MLYRFDDFELDLDRIELRARGERMPLEPQVFALLALLVDARDRLVSKDEIFEKIWDGRIVTDAALASRIKSARQALGDNGPRSGSSARSTAAAFASSRTCGSRRRAGRPESIPSSSGHGHRLVPPAARPTSRHGLRSQCCRFA